VLDLGYVDEERVARVFRQYAYTPHSQKTRPCDFTGG
jgi:hypothetical protein